MRDWFHQLAGRLRSPAAPRRFNLPPGVRAYAVGDIHGRPALLAELLERIRDDAMREPAERTVEIFLGDYIDRGPDSRGVIDLLLTQPPAGHEQVFLKGNHEQALLDFLYKPDILRDWLQFGGLPTLDAYGVRIPSHVDGDAAPSIQAAFRKALPDTHRQFFTALQPCYELGDYFFVHAGVMPHRPLTEQREEDMLWIRQPFLSHRDYFEKYIVHGHTPQSAPQLLANRANLDLCNAPTDTLCALRIEADQLQLLQTGLPA